MVGLGWLHIFLDGSGWSWELAGGLGGFKRFSVIYSFSSYGEIRCFKFKRSWQLWGVFVVSSNNDAKVPLKHMTKFLGNSAYKVSLKMAWVGERSFVLWKLIYIALCKFFPFWLCSSPFWLIFFKNLPIWLIIGWQVSILDWVSDKHSYLLKPCCHYIFQFSILSISTKVMEGNGNHWTFLKSHCLFSGNLRKNQILIYPRTLNILSCKRAEIFKSFTSLISSLPAISLKKYTFTCWLLVCVLFEVNFSFIHSFHAGSLALVNDFKSSSSENVTKSCIFESNYFSDVEILLSTLKK